MSRPEIDEDQLDRIYEALGDVKRVPPFNVAADLGVVIDELIEWLDDDRQWISAHSSQWVSLLDDLSGARAAAGPATQIHLDGATLAWDELRVVRGALRRHQKRGPDPAIRRRLRRAADSIGELIAAPAALDAIWVDLVTSASNATAARRARDLFLLAGRQGHDGMDLTRWLREILADRLVAVRHAQGKPRGATEPLDLAGLSPTERINLAGSILPNAPRRADTVVWLKYALAAIGPEVLRIGDAVTFYRQDYLQDALSPEPASELPAELHSETTFGGVESLASSAGVDAEVPCVIVRVAVGNVHVAESLDLARETAEVVVSLATLHGTDPSIWVLAKDHVKFLDGREGGSSAHAPDVLGATLDQQSAINSDPMPEVFDAWSDELEPHLPLRNPGLRRAAQLALWLRRARQAWEPGRLVLCDRIFEQVSGWAGVIERGTFIHGYLRLPWALGLVRLELRNCWSQIASSDFRPYSDVSAEAWEEIKADPTLEYRDMGQGWRVNLRGVLERIDFLIERIEPNTSLHERASLLRRRTETGKAAARWVDELLGDFDVFEKRARRLRNSLIHGGPLSDDSARSVLTFVDWLAADALTTSIRGFLRDGDLVGHFLDRRTNFEARLSALRRDEPPVTTLFWDEG